MPEIAVRLEHVVKRQAGRAVLDGVSLDVAAGRIVGLAGLNGAGKTTLLRCLLDFCALDGGTITLFGQPHAVPAARAPLAFLPERFQPPAHLSGGEFLAYTQALHGQRPDEAATSAMLDALQLDRGAMGKTARHYSKGMTQKLGLAATLLLDKRLYVLDEPASGLDPQARALFMRAVRARVDQGAAVLLTSHALADIDALCDRMAILHGGRVVYAGTPADCAAMAGGNLEHAFLAAVA